jgi:cobalt/nickel transport system permease protein
MFSHALHPIDCGKSYIAQVDPRAKIVFAIVWTMLVAIVKNPPALVFAVLGGLLLVAAARISPGDLLRRLLPLEMLLVLLAILLFVPTRGHDSLRLASVIALKANAAMLTMIALIGTMDAVALGHALAHLYMPRRLVQLLLFMVRYFDVLGREYARLRAAMRVRCFRPRMNGHSYRAIGYLVGMLLVRSFERCERVLAAMKCRGFRGRYYMLNHFAFAPRRDVPFCALMLVLVAILLGLEWRCV